MHPKVFLKIAKESSMEDTVHIAHFLNWPTKVYGTHLLDYGNKKREVYDKSVGNIGSSTIFINMIGRFQVKGIRKNALNHPINKFGELACMNYSDNFIKYYFDEGHGYKVHYDVPQKEFFNIFSKTQGCFHLTFSFNN